MMLIPWKRLSVTTIKKNRWWEYRQDRCLLPSGEESEYHYMHIDGSVLIVPVMQDGRVLFVRQWRYLLEEETIEFPGGKRETSQTFQEAALHEMKGEIGYTPDSLHEIGRLAPFPGVCDEICHVFLATGLRATTAEPDPSEAFLYAAYSIEQVDALIQTGGVVDGQTLAAWTLARPHITMET